MRPARRIRRRSGPAQPLANENEAGWNDEAAKPAAGCAVALAETVAGLCARTAVNRTPARIGKPKSVTLRGMEVSSSRIDVSGPELGAVHFG